MLDFEFFNRKKRVQTALTSKINTGCVDEMRYQDRKASRTVYSQVVWLVPCQGKTPDYAQATPAVSKDISIEGLALLHTAPVNTKGAVVGLPGENGPTFLWCDVEHSTALGYGFFQIGLAPERVLNPTLTEFNAWKARCAEFEPTPAAV
jgi:hypothetical protein